MYPFLRMALSLRAARRAPPLVLGETDSRRLICWPWDIDMWAELNNGRTLTLYDLGRLAMARRTGLLDTLARHGWGMTVAGSSVRYRRRVHAFDRLTLTSRVIGWDTRFFYLEHALWRGEICTSHGLFRGAVTGPEGIVAPGRVAEALGAGPSPALPGWVAAWIEAEAERPWPPAR